MPRGPRRNPPPAAARDIVAQQSIQQQPGQRPVQPPAAPTGLPYGEHQDLIQAQQHAPLPAAGPAVPSPAGGPPSPGGGGGWDQTMAVAGAHPPPNLPPMGGPSQRPLEPTTHGLPSGPGGGPEVMGGGTPQPLKVSQMYLGMYQQTGIAAYAQLAQTALARGQ